MVRLGIDCRRDKLCVARVEDNAGRRQITELFATGTDLAEELLTSSDRITLSVPDNLAIVKSIHLPDEPAHNIRKRLCFEMEQSLPEPAGRFAFDLLPGSYKNQHLGIAYRRDSLSQLATEYRLPCTVEPSFCLRARGLGIGYLHFTSAPAAGLVGLVDVAGPVVSVCLVYEKSIVAMGHLLPADVNSAGSSFHATLPVELKTLLNFKQMALRKQGITTPLSLLVVNGDGINDPLCERFEHVCNTPVAGPNINTGYLALPENAETPPLGNFLVAMGLAAN